MLVKGTLMTRSSIVLAGFLLLVTIAQAEEEPVAFPYTVTEKTRERQLSAAMHRSFFHYKSAFNRPHALWVAQGLAIAEHPLGPFTKHPLNPVLNSSHEIALFPFKKGVACLSIRDGQEHFTVQYAEDWVNFEIASITELMPIVAGPFAPDAFDDSGDGRGITWGISHFKNAARDWSRQHSVLTRFDCDLSLDVHDPEMKRSHIDYPPEHHYKFGLSKKQCERISTENQGRKERRK
jgi:hypothetical protein